MLPEKARDKFFWTKIKEKEEYKEMLSELFSQYEESTKTPLCALKYSEYNEFFENGSRETYEKRYFLRRKRLNSCALLSLIFPENGEYLKELLDTIWAICDEYTWSVPAHAECKDEIDENLLDLFAAETGFALAEIKFLLSERLPEIIKKRISKGISLRIFDSFKKRNYWWKTYENNWAAVCAASVGICFMYEAPESFYEIKPEIDSILEYFFRSYKEDGVCREGLAYWEYGFGFFVFYADMLKRFSKGKYDYFKEERVKKISQFMQNMFLTENAMISFSDGSMNGNYKIGIMHMLKSVYGEKIELPPKRFGTITDKCARWCWEMRAFLYYDENFVLEKEENEKEIFYDLSGWFIKKKKRYAFAIKGGDNGEPHNHNDVGSFIFAVNGTQFLCDLGAGEYTAQYFKPDSCETIFCKSSLSHNVPIIDGKGQKTGETFKGIICVNEEGVSVGFSSAYESANLKGLTRNVIFLDDKVILQDKFVHSGTFRERFVSTIMPEVCGDKIKIGKKCFLNYDKNNFSPEISMQKYNLHSCEEATAYLIDFIPLNKNNMYFVMDICLDTAYSAKPAKIKCRK